MRYLIGLDGGGTKTKCVVTDHDLNILNECIGGPSNFLVYGTEDVSKTLLSTIKECTDQLKINADEIDSVLLGTAGAGRRDDAERLENEFIKLAEKKGILFKYFRVESDARIALEGAFSGLPGSILIAGTGSIMFGKDLDGNIHRVGGFGRILGDEGSGFHIGRLGLSAVAKYYDGRGPRTILKDMIERVFNITDSSSMITEVYKNKFDVASVAPLVMKAAEQGDEVCVNILNSEIEELIEHVNTMKVKLNESVLKISLIGGTITTENYYSNLFKEKVELIEGVQLKEPELPPQVGAALMAKQFCES